MPATHANKPAPKRSEHAINLLDGARRTEAEENSDSELHDSGREIPPSEHDRDREKCNVAEYSNYRLEVHNELRGACRQAHTRLINIPKSPRIVVNTLVQERELKRRTGRVGIGRETRKRRLDAEYSMLLLRARGWYWISLLNIRSGVFTIISFPRQRVVGQIVNSRRMNNRIDSLMKKIALNKTRVYMDRDFIVIRYWSLAKQRQRPNYLH